MACALSMLLIWLILTTFVASSDCHVSSATAARILGVQIGAPRAAVKKAYRRAAAQSHPDVSSAPDATHQFLTVAAAYATLLRQGQHAATEQPAASTDYSGRRAARRQPASSVDASARARWAEFWEAEIALTRVEASLNHQRVMLHTLQDRRDRIVAMLVMHASAAEAWPGSALASTIKVLRRQELEVMQSLSQSSLAIQRDEEHRERCASRVADVRARCCF